MANLQTGFTTFLALPLAAGATTATLGTVPTATQGRLHLYDGAQEERVSYTGVSGVTVTGLTRNLSQTADPATGGTGLTWIAGTTVDFVAMHDQIVDKTGSNTFATGTIQTFPDIAFTGTTTGGIRVKNLTTAQRDAIASPLAGQIIYNTTTLVMNQYIAGAWTDFSTGTTAAASTTVAGKVEIATQAENTAGTATGGTGALLSTTPDVMATTIQRGERLYAGASATGNDTYVVTMTPALAAYTTGMRISFKTDVANTGACSINVNGLGAKSIKLFDGTDPYTGYIKATSIVSLTYDGTNMVLQGQLNARYGNGSDLAISATGVTVTGSNNTYILKQYTTFAPGSNTVTITPTNCILHIKVQGNCNLTGTTFTFNGKGASGGGGGGSAADQPGAIGGAGNKVNGKILGGQGGDTTLVYLRGNNFFANDMGLQIIASCGSGGGGGRSSGFAGAGGNGGAGGGCIILEVGGDITFSSTTMNFQGSDGSNSGGSAGGGGGGGGGSIIVLYKGTLSGSPTSNVAGGSGGTGSTYTGGGGGNSIINDGSGPIAGNGSSGGNGVVILQQIL